MATREQASEMTSRALALAALCGGFFANNPPEIVGAALADLMADFLRNHRLFGDQRGEREMREAVFQQWIDTVRQLLLLYDSSPVGTQ